jgi:hypothetical protein
MAVPTVWYSYLRCSGRGYDMGTRKYKTDGKVHGKH